MILYNDNDKKFKLSSRMKNYKYIFITLTTMPKNPCNKTDRIKGRYTDSLKIIVNTLLSIIDRTNGQMINKDIGDLNNIINQPRFF